MTGMRLRVYAKTGTGPLPSEVQSLFHTDSELILEVDLCPEAKHKRCLDTFQEGRDHLHVRGDVTPRSANGGAEDLNLPPVL
jgi:hypothetical protein